MCILRLPGSLNLVKTRWNPPVCPGYTQVGGGGGVKCLVHKIRIKEAAAAGATEKSCVYWTLGLAKALYFPTKCLAFQIKLAPGHFWHWTDHYFTEEGGEREVFFSSLSRAWLFFWCARVNGPIKPVKFPWCPEHILFRVFFSRSHHKVNWKLPSFCVFRPRFRQNVQTLLLFQAQCTKYASVLLIIQLV